MRLTLIPLLIVLISAIAVAAPVTGGNDALNLAPIALSVAQQTMAGIEVTPLVAGPAPGAGRLTFGGRVEFADRGPAGILAPASGRVIAVFAHPGEWVNTGAPVLAIAGPEIVTARHSLTVATTAANNVRTRLTRDKALYAAGAIARSRLESTETQARDAEATLMAARVMLSGGVFDASGALQLRAPATGRVLGTALAPGDAVVAGQALGYVSATPQIHVSLAVPASVARSLAVNDGVFITSPGCEATGHLHAIGQNVDPDTQAVVVHASIEGSQCLVAGETVTARLNPRGLQTGAFALPATAFVAVGAQSYVFRATAAGFEPVPVDLAAMQMGVARSDVLKAGDRIVTRGAAILKAEWQKRTGA